MKKLSDIYNELKKTMSNQEKEKEVAVHLIAMVQNLYRQSMASNDGYCYSFNLPIVGVNNLFSILKIDKDELERAFRESWGYPPGTKMYSEPYYHILLLLTYYGVKEDNKIIANKAFLLVLVRVWKGRRSHYLKHCNPEIMRYVINNMMTSRNLLTKYQSPIFLLSDYFVPTLLEKYGPEMKKSEAKIKNLFMQSYSRIGQLFGYNAKINPETGKVEYQDGILPLYMKAREGGLTSVKTSKQDIRFDENVENIREEIVKKTVNGIVLTANPTYPNSLINAINQKTKVSSKRISQILISMHKNKYYDILYDITVLILARVGIRDRSDIFTPDFNDNVIKNIISSKNNPEVNKITMLLNKLLMKIFEEDLGEGRLFEKYSNVQKSQLRNVIVFGIVYNLREYNKK